MQQQASLNLCGSFQFLINDFICFHVVRFVLVVCTFPFKYYEWLKQLDFPQLLLLKWTRQAS